MSDSLKTEAPRRNDLTAEQLREVMDYSPDTGIAVMRRTGNVVTRLNSSGYLRVCVNGFDYRLHRLAWLHHYGAWPADQIDHINGIRTDNRIANLRDVTPAMNGQNRNRPEPCSKLGVLGVVKPRDIYYAVLGVGKKKYWKPAATLEEAKALYLELKRLHHPGYVPDEQKLRSQ